MLPSLILDLTIMGIQLVSEANQRDNHWVRAKRKKDHSRTCWMTVRARLPNWAPCPVVITLTRIGARRLDADNLAGSFKGVQDGVAEALLMDDGDQRITWRYEQETVKPVNYGLRIRIEAP